MEGLICSQGGGAVKINEAEALVGMTKKNIRFYEEQGLLSPRRNSENGYRDYTDADVDALRRIKLLRKLGVPISEIRAMQEGRQTVADGMRRHLVLLEREKSSLEQSIRLCELLRESQTPLRELDGQAVLDRMAQLEQEGAAFPNTQRQDIRVRYAAPVLAAVLMVILMAAVIGLFVWAYTAEPAEAPPLALMAVLMLVPLAVIGGVVLALIQRIREIGKGEVDDAKKY